MIVPKSVKNDLPSELILRQVKGIVEHKYFIPIWLQLVTYSRRLRASVKSLKRCYSGHFSSTGILRPKIRLEDRACQKFDWWIGGEPFFSCVRAKFGSGQSEVGLDVQKANFSWRKVWQWPIRGMIGRAKGIFFVVANQKFWAGRIIISILLCYKIQ